MADTIPPHSRGREPTLQVRIATRTTELDAAAWDGLEHGPSPFLRHGFLRALEESGSIGKGSGWHPFYVLAEEDRAGAQSPSLVGAACAFVKSHSYGEYIFDWGWANASERAGIPYYPKLVVAAPATPASGRRLLLAPGVDADRVTEALVAGLFALAEDAGCSSIHVLFCTAEERDRLVRLGFAGRDSFQFHWHNRGYADYEAFLAALTSRKRKQLRKERRRAREHIDRLDFVAGRDLSEGDLDALDRFYRRTTAEHGGMDYLRPGFFHAAARSLPEQMRFARAVRSGEVIAGALFFETAQGLYGRYWGCDEAHEFLHFEIAYYAGIERCIERNIPLFEAGAQGEHKLLRGFLPSPTYSAHWIRHPGLFEGISEFLAREADAVARRMRELAEYAPYRCE